MLQCIAQTFLAAVPQLSEQVLCDLLELVAGLCPHDERIISKLRETSLGAPNHERQFWNALIQSEDHRLSYHPRLRPWYWVRLAQTYSFIRNYAEAEACIDEAVKTELYPSLYYYDIRSTSYSNIHSTSSKIDFGCNPREFWLRKTEENPGYFNTTTLAIVCQKIPYNLLEIEMWKSLVTRHPFNGYSQNCLRECFKKERAKIPNHPWDSEITFWKDGICASSATFSASIDDLHSTLGLRRESQGTPFSPTVFDMEIEVWYDILKTGIYWGAEAGAYKIIEFLQAALRAKADAVEDNTYRHVATVWRSAKNIWTRLKSHNASSHPPVVSEMQKQLDEACALLQVLEADDAGFGGNLGEV